jgi:hypothetical protein
MNNSSSPVCRPIAWLLALACSATTWQPTCAAPPIKNVFDECAVEQLTWNDAAASYDAGCAEAPCAIGGDCAIGGHPAACTGPCCGRDVCCPIVEEVTDEKTCWNVKCEKVCIPAVRLPWEPGGSGLTLFSWLGGYGRHSCGGGVACSETCTHGTGPAACYPAKCGKVRCVRILEPDSYEVTSCQCKWEIRRLPCCCGNENCAGGCGARVDDQALEHESDSAINGVLPIPVPMP